MFCIIRCIFENRYNLTYGFQENDLIFWNDSLIVFLADGMVLDILYQTQLILDCLPYYHKENQNHQFLLFLILAYILLILL
jgi:hypothetical protein